MNNPIQLHFVRLQRKDDDLGSEVSRGMRT